ncbi:MAG: B12-binding domain-containing radical SAM protein [Rhodospirillaceae bacterium]
MGLVGVQSNQFPRAMDLARAFRKAGIAVVIGGFHVSGCLSMLPGIQPEIQEALDLGVGLFAGEAEGHMDEVLRDAACGALKPIYNYLEHLPELAGATIPLLPRALLQRAFGTQTSFDAGRGCPFKCSFCTIINVQGRTSRCRSVDDVERVIRVNLAQDVTRYFITDDNFARNKNWEQIFDRLIQLREREGIKITFTLQVDTLCHKLKNFIPKAARAGTTKVFIGLENINPEALLGAQKRQNRVSDYREMMQAWHDEGVIIFAGYIIGFPDDTAETVLRDIKIIQRELPVDFLEFFYLTPLPGSQDHKELFTRRAWMDPDLNKYDLFHIVSEHPRMGRTEWAEAYRLAWKTFYSFAHIETLFRRARASNIPLRQMLTLTLWFAGTIAVEGVHPLEGGYLRRKVRTSRRPGLRAESPLLFYPRYWGEVLTKHIRFLALIARLRWIAWKVMRTRSPYQDCTLPSACTANSELSQLLTHAKAIRAGRAGTARQPEMSSETGIGG